MHAEANAIIHASRADMIGSTLYLVGQDAATGELVPDASPCSMCKRLIHNAGISRVVIRNTPDAFTAIYVQEWIEARRLARRGTGILNGTGLPGGRTAARFFRRL